MLKCSRDLHSKTAVKAPDESSTARLTLQYFVVIVLTTISCKNHSRLICILREGKMEREECITIFSWATLPDFVHAIRVWRQRSAQNLDHSYGWLYGGRTNSDRMMIMALEKENDYLPAGATTESEVRCRILTGWAGRLGPKLCGATVTSPCCEASTSCSLDSNFRGSSDNTTALCIPAGMMEW